MLRRYTKVWLDKRIGELNRGDGRRVIDEGLITGIRTSPVHGPELPKPESKMKPILTQDEIKLLMFEAY